MSLEDLIKPERVACKSGARSKKHCLELLAELLAGPEAPIPSEDIFALLVERERLGCTSLAQGTAFPHCRVAGLEAPRGALLKLASPVEFDAVDGETVDLVFGLMVPEVLEESDYAAVDRITALMSDAGLSARLRAAKNDRELYRALMTAETGARVGNGRARRG